MVGEVRAYHLYVYLDGVAKVEAGPVGVARLEVADLEADGGLRTPDLLREELDLDDGVVPPLGCVQDIRIRERR